MHSSGDRVERNPDLLMHIFWEQLLQPLRLDRSRERKNGIHFILASSQFLNFSGHQNSLFVDNAFTRQCPAPAMNKLAAQSALVDATCNTIAESDNDAFSQRLV